MKKAILLISFFAVLLISCFDKKEDPAPKAPALEGKWRFKEIAGYRNDVNTNGQDVRMGMLGFVDAYLDFVPGTTYLNFYQQGSTLAQTGKYSLNNNQLMLTLDTLGIGPNELHYIDSLTHSNLVFRSDTTYYPTNDGFTFYIYRLQK